MLLRINGYYSTLLEEIHQTLQKESDDKINWYDNAIAEIKSIENQLAKDAGWVEENYHGFSYFKINGYATPCWHRDGHKETILMAYPNPTQVLLCLDDTPVQFDSSFGIVEIDHYSKTLLDSGQAKILTLPVGVPYLLTNAVVHRSNPEAKNKSHLVVRIYKE